jgi:PAS domain S-box-containing protein
MSTIATPSPVDDGLDPSSGGVVAQDQTAALWQTAILAIGRRVATAVGNTDQLTSDAALALAEALDFDFCGVAQPPANGGLSIALNAAKFSVSLPTEPLILPDRPDDSLVAFAMASGRLIATPDIAAETRYRDLILRRCQAHSALACPLRANGVNYGSILLANLAPRVVSAHEFACIENICHLVAGAAARCRLEQLLSVSQFNGQVLEAVDTSLVLLDADLRIEQINQRCEDLTGFLLSEVQHRPYCSAFVATGEEDDIKQIFAQILSDGEPRQFKAKLLRKHGDERRVEWRFRRIAGSLPGVLVGTGVDITEKCDL